MTKKLNINVLLLAITSAFALAACNSGTSSSHTPVPIPTQSPTPVPTPSPSPSPLPTPSPTPSPTPVPPSNLQLFVGSLSHSSNVISTPNQSSFTLNTAAVVDNIQIAYYSSSNCSTGLNNVVNISGNVYLSPGTYTSVNYSNYVLCSMYQGGCAGLFDAVQNAAAWAMQYTYHYSNGTSYQSVCMSNPANPIGKSAELFADYTSGVAACTAGNSCQFSQAYSLPLGWSTQNGAAGGTTYGTAINVDSGNIYNTGVTTVALSGQLESSVQDTYIAKYTESGVLQWLKQFGAGAGTPSYGITNDIDGNSYVAGYTYGALSGQTQTGIKDYYITKYDPNGNMIWVHQVGVTGHDSPAYGISTEKNGNSYLAGTTNGALPGQTQNGNEDYFIVKYDTSGSLIWTRQVGVAGGLTRGLGISTDSVDNSYITGYTTVGLSGQTQTGTRDYYVAKYDTSGNLIWTRQVGGTGGTTSGAAISSDLVGNSYITGTTTVGLSGQTQNGTNDYFIAKYDTNGNLIWTRQVGAASGTTNGRGIDVDGNIYVTGSTTVGLSGQTQNGTNDYFIAKYDTSGNLLSTTQMGAAGGSDVGRGVSHVSQNSYVTGWSTVGLSGQTQTGTNDYFIAKIPN